MRLLRTFILLLAVTIVFSALNGCHRGPVPPKGMPRRVPCIFIFTQDSLPLTDATVTLEMIERNAFWRVSGITDETGSVDLMTDGLFKGVPEGKYKIVVEKSARETTKPKLPPAPTDPNYVEWMKKNVNLPIRPQPLYTLVEKKYISVETSPLEIEISGSKKIRRTFDVGKKVREKL